MRRTARAAMMPENLLTRRGPFPNDDVIYSPHAIRQLSSRLAHHALLRRLTVTSGDGPQTCFIRRVDPRIIGSESPIGPESAADSETADRALKHPSSDVFLFSPAKPVGQENHRGGSQCDCYCRYDR